MTGGAARGSLWPGIISSITGIEVLIPQNSDEDFATKGAAILAGYGVGIFPSMEEGYKRLKTEFKAIKPDLKKRGYYKDKFKKYLKNAQSM